jgi:hypothetical protein
VGRTSSVTLGERTHVTPRRATQQHEVRYGVALRKALPADRRDHRLHITAIDRWVARPAAKVHARTFTAEPEPAGRCRPRRAPQHNAQDRPLTPVKIAVGTPMVITRVDGASSGRRRQARPATYTKHPLRPLNSWRGRARRARAWPRGHQGLNRGRVWTAERINRDYRASAMPAVST